MGCGSSSNAHGDSTTSLKEADYEAIAARRLGSSTNRPAKAVGPASIHAVFQNLPHIAGAEDVLFPLDADPLGPLTASQCNFKLGLYASSHMEQGKRPYMEDKSRCIADLSVAMPGFPSQYTPACFFGVFDGHGGTRERVGDQVAEFLQHNLADRLFTALMPAFERYRALKSGEDLPPSALLPSPSPPDHSSHASTVSDVPVGLQALAMQARKLSMATLVEPDFVRIATSVFRRFDNEVLSQGFIDTAGSTCTIATIFGDALVVMNTGDSDAVLCRKGEPKRLTVQHKAGDLSEAQRISNAGGFVMNVAGTYRVAGMLEVSRDIGCALLKRECPGLIPDPHVCVVELCEFDEFLIIGSDGLFEVYTNLRHLVREVKEMLRETKSVDDTCRRIVQGVVQSPFSNDNVSMVLVVFNRDGVITARAGACGGEVGYASTARPFLRAPAARRPSITAGKPVMHPPIAQSPVNAPTPAPAPVPAPPPAPPQDLATSRASAPAKPPLPPVGKTSLTDMFRTPSVESTVASTSTPVDGRASVPTPIVTASTSPPTHAKRPSASSAPAPSPSAVINETSHTVIASVISDMNTRLGGSPVPSNAVSTDVDVSVDGAVDAADGTRTMFTTVA